LIQHLPGLVRLRALHIVHFRNSDTCIWVVRESMRFIVDCVANNPQLKLEWIAMEDERVDRILRPSEYNDDPDNNGTYQKGLKAKRIQDKKDELAALATFAQPGGGAGAVSDPPGPSGLDTAPPVLPATDNWEFFSDSDDEAEPPLPPPAAGSAPMPFDDDLYTKNPKLKMKTMSGVQFFDIWGVKIFTKEVRAGRL
jgi:hypothetical protein